ncbi:MAG: hypothetical protein HC767_03940 [Akkermansiaceae bacterium]|nr:hypothetical protein [Akkermansiaceae bacterium]
MARWHAAAHTLHEDFVISTNPDHRPFPVALKNHICEINGCCAAGGHGGPHHQRGEVELPCFSFWQCSPQVQVVGPEIRGHNAQHVVVGQQKALSGWWWAPG